MCHVRDDVLTAAWRKLESSGVLQQRNIADGLGVCSRGSRQVLSTLAADTAARGLRPCSLASCGAREGHPGQFKACAACKGAVYCCKQHRADHWPSHKAARKAAAA
jgi:hypothetical protein